MQRKESEKVCKVREKSGETCAKSSERRERNRIPMASMRASETCEESLERREQNRTRMASMRASGTPSKMLQRNISNKDHNMAILQQSTVTVENAISAFQCAVKLGPDSSHLRRGFAL